MGSGSTASGQKGEDLGGGGVSSSAAGCGQGSKADEWFKPFPNTSSSDSNCTDSSESDSSEEDEAEKQVEASPSRPAKVIEIEDLTPETRSKPAPRQRSRTHPPRKDNDEVVEEVRLPLEEECAS